MILVLQRARLGILTIETERGTFSLVGNIWATENVVGIHCIDGSGDWIQFNKNVVKSIVFDPTQNG